MIRLCLFLFVLCAGPLNAQTLNFPSNAVLTAEETVALGSFDLPAGPWAEAVLPVARHEGALTRQAWRIDATDITTLQILRPLREQLRNAGMAVIFECETATCGGFDFRFATPVMLPPDMQVNLGDFRYLSAEGSDVAFGIMVSKTADAGFVQVTRVGPADAPLATASAPNVRGIAVAEHEEDLATHLETTGRFVLSGLEFETGSAQLAADENPALAALAHFLAAHPDRQVALVGHTDSAGSLDGNIALSKRRAAAVMERLVTYYQVPRRQMEAQGMGYLAPLASNLTEDGRSLNRRVEVIITSTGD